MKTVFSSLIFLFCGVVSLTAQGFQFSQIDLNRTLHHAAAPALIEQKGQLLAAYRSAWTKQIPFRNLLLSYDHRVNDFTIGARLNQQDAGSASLKMLGILVDVTYKKQLNESGDFIAFGLNGGIMQRRFQAQDFQFDSQYVEGLGVDSGLDHGEAFLNTNHNIPTLQVGILGKKYFNRLNVLAGLSINNVNKPSASFYEMSSVELDRAIFTFTEITLPWSERLLGTVYLSFNASQHAKEQLVALKVSYRMTEKNWIHFSVGSRINQAFVLAAGLQFAQSTITASYDFNHTTLSNLEGFGGAFELSARHNF